MKAVCISCFNYYENRVKYIESFLSGKGYEVYYITSNFAHIEKTRFKIDKPNVIQIDALPYHKNLSPSRLMSHYLFSRKVIGEVRKIKPDVIYAVIPPNYLLKFLSQYKKKNAVKLICDLYDLWPETFPSGKAKKILALPFQFWSSLRDKHLRFADAIITECELYQEKLKTQLAKLKAHTLYLTKEDLNVHHIPSAKVDQNSIGICYLGSINNIIDIQLIADLLASINKRKPVVLHIIGDGENREYFLSVMKSRHIQVQFYGKVYEEATKRAIFDKCSFGLNLMKHTVCVGLTMKSIDYFQAGLPILNNIPADTAKIVEQYGIGFNITAENMEEIARKVAGINSKNLMMLKTRTRNVFDELFSKEAFDIKLKSILRM